MIVMTVYDIKNRYLYELINFAVSNQTKSLSHIKNVF